MLTAELQGIDHRVGILLAVLCGMVIGIIAYVLIYPIPLVGYDFEAFWCGARVVLQHGNPYANQPLHACEVAASPGFFEHYPQVTIPVPLPAYAIALFTPFAFLPFTAARAIWWVIQFACAFAIGRGISQISGMPPVTALAASVLAVIGPAVLQAALSPVPIALTVLAALALRRRRWNAAALLLGFAMMEPHMVLPACAAVFLFVPQMRVRLLVAGLCAGAIMLATVGPYVSLSYFTTVLPQHAASEVNNLGQFSLTALLYQLGAGAQFALHVGVAQYALLAIAGIAAAQLLRTKSGDLSWLVLLPAAFAVIGGSFIHLNEIAMAVPLACLILMRTGSKVALAIVVLLALPAESILDWIVLAVPAAIISLWFMDRPDAGLKRYAANGLLPLAVTVALIAGTSALHWIGAAHAQQALDGIVTFPDPGRGAGASAPWATYNALARRTLLWWPEKLYTLVPLAALVVLCGRELFVTAARKAEALAVLRTEPERA